MRLQHPEDPDAIKVTGEKLFHFLDHIIALYSQDGKVRTAKSC